MSLHERTERLVLEQAAQTQAVGPKSSPQRKAAQARWSLHNERSAAFHEVGHWAFSNAAGFGNRFVKIERGGGGEFLPEYAMTHDAVNIALVAADGGWEWDEPLHAVSTTRCFLTYCGILYAGPMAELLYRPKRDRKWRHGASLDYLAAAKFIDQWFPNDGMSCVLAWKRAHLYPFLARVENWVLEHRSVISELATLLARKERLEKDEMDREIARYSLQTPVWMSPCTLLERRAAVMLP